ncbi:surface antigen repeat-containing protein [Toxoplasma gondii VEG]|uniref:Surface antigen repeat-containing protein n=1 Tax=Toxoplasma gondii (strain ATCC 50861 / VEG) TaxID=432359 RepID=V5B4T5_TOXGV|nr:surface antigen repeat-containing protein [Toxoplasma gondii VEG]
MSSGLWQIFKRKGKDGGEAETKATKAHMGEENKMYYNEKLKRWVVRGEEHLVEQEQLPPPPPTAAALQKPGNSDAGAALPSAGPRSFARGRTARSLYTATPGLSVRPAATSTAASLPKPAFVLPPFAASRLAVCPPSLSQEAQASSLPPGTSEEDRANAPPGSRDNVGERLGFDAAAKVCGDAGSTDKTGQDSSLGESVLKGENLSEQQTPDPSLPVFSSSPVSASAGLSQAAAAGGARGRNHSGLDFEGGGSSDGVHLGGSTVSREPRSPCLSERKRTQPSRCEGQNDGQGIHVEGSGSSPCVAPETSIASPFGLPGDPASVSLSPPLPQSLSTPGPAQAPAAALMPSSPRLNADAFPADGDLSFPTAFVASQPADGAGQASSREETFSLHASGRPRGGLSVALESSSGDEEETSSVTLDDSSEGSLSWRDTWRPAEEAVGYTHRRVSGGETADAASPQFARRELVRDRQQRTRGDAALERPDCGRGRRAGSPEAAGILQTPAYAAALKEWMEEPSCPREVDLGHTPEGEQTQPDGEGRPEELRSVDAGLAGARSEAQVSGHPGEVSGHPNEEMSQWTEAAIPETESNRISSPLHAPVPAELAGGQGSQQVPPPEPLCSQPVQCLDTPEVIEEDLVLQDPWSPDRVGPREGGNATRESEFPEDFRGVSEPFSPSPVEASLSVAGAGLSQIAPSASSCASVASLAPSAASPPSHFYTTELGTEASPEPTSLGEEPAFQGTAFHDDRGTRFGESPVARAPAVALPAVSILGRLDGFRDEPSPLGTHRTQIFHLADADDAGVGASSVLSPGGFALEPQDEAGEQSRLRVEAQGEFAGPLGSSLPANAQSSWGDENGEAKPPALDGVDWFYRSDAAGEKNMQEQALAQAQRAAFSSDFEVAESASVFCEDAGLQREGVIAAFSASVEELERTSGTALEQLQEQRRLRLELERKNTLLQRQLHAVLVLLSRFSLSGQDRRRLLHLLQPAASPKSELMHATLNPSQREETREDPEDAGDRHLEGAVAAWTEAKGEKAMNCLESEVAALAGWSNGRGEDRDWMVTKDVLDEEGRHQAGRCLSQHTIDAAQLSGDEEDADFDADLVEADEVREAFNTLTQLLASQLEMQSASRAELEVCQAEAEGYLLLVEEQQKQVIEPLCRRVAELQREHAEEKRQTTQLRQAQEELLRRYEGAAVATEDLCMEVARSRAELASKASLVARLEAEVQEQQTRVRDFRDALDAKERELENAAGALRGLHVQLDSERNQRMQSEEEQRRREREAAEHHEAVTKALAREKDSEALSRQQETQELRAEIEKVQARLERVHGELEGARESLRSAREEAEHHAAETASLKEKEMHLQEEWNRRITSLSDELEAVRAMHASEKAQLSEAHHATEHAFATFRQDAARREEEREQEIQQLRDAMKKVEEDQRGSLQPEKAKQLELELDAARAETDSLRREALELRDAAECLRMQLETARADQQQAAAAFEDRLRRAVDEEKEAFFAERRRVEATHAEALTSLRAELSREQADRAAHEKLAEELKACECALARERGEKEEAARAWQEELTLATRRQEEQEEEMKNKQAEIDVLNAMQDELQEQLAELRSRCSQLSSQLSAKEEEAPRGRDEEMACMQRQLAETVEEKGRLASELATVREVYAQQSEEQKKQLEDLALSLQASEREVADLQRRLEAVTLDVERQQQEAKAEHLRALEAKQSECMRKAGEAANASERAEATQRLLEAVQTQLEEKEKARVAVERELEALREAVVEKENALAAASTKNEELAQVTAELAAQEEHVAALRRELEAQAQQFAASEATLQAALSEAEKKSLACEARMREELQNHVAAASRIKAEEESRMQFVLEQEKKKVAAEEAEKLRKTFERLWDQESAKMLQAYEAVARQLAEAQRAMHAKGEELEEVKKREAEARRAALDATQEASEVQELREKLAARDAELSELRSANKEQTEELATVRANQTRLAEEAARQREALEKQRDTLEKEREVLRGQVEDAKDRERERARQTEEQESCLRRALAEREDEARQTTLRLQVLEEELETEKRRNASAEKRRGEEIRQLQSAVHELKEREKEEKKRVETETAEFSGRLRAAEEEAERRQRRTEELLAELDEARRVPPTVEGVKKQAQLIAKQNEELRMRTATLSTTSDFLSRRLQFFEDALDSLGPSGRAIVLEADRCVQPPEPVDAEAIPDEVLAAAASPLNEQTRGRFLSSHAVTEFRDTTLNGSSPAAGGDALSICLPVEKLQMSPLPADGSQNVSDGTRMPPKPPAFMQAFLPASRSGAGASGGPLQGVGAGENGN